ncbi:Microtubule-nucleating Tub4p (gamma-tubulin) complex component [Cryptotrichosporon argae]
MSRSRPPSQSHKSHLETLIYAVVPDLAPKRASSTTDEAARRERVRELVDVCDELLQRRGSAPLDVGALPEQARLLLGRTDADKALRFNGTWSKLERGKTLASPGPHLQFLLGLSKISQAAARAAPAVFPAHAQAQPAQPAASSSRRPLEGVAPNVPVPGAVWLAASTSGKGKSKAEMLRAWRTSQSRPPFPDALLLRDTLYLLQGIDGRYVRFAVRPPKQHNPYLALTDGAGFPINRPQDGDEDEVVGIDLAIDEAKDGYITEPTKTLLVQISEMGVLYRKVTDFVKRHAASATGMVIQSLCHFLHHELSSYHRLLAVLEAQMSAASEGEPSQAESSKLTLMRLGLWTEEMRLKLRLMVAIVDDAKTTRGGALVSKIHAHTSHGDPLVRKFTDQILEEVSKPFFLTLQRWIFSGELHDPYKEFFVQLNPETSSTPGRTSPHHDAGFESGLAGLDIGGEDAGAVWETKYVFVKGMVPGFVSEDFGKKIFSTGRSLNFIRYNCYDSEWITTQTHMATALKYSDLAGLERSIDDAYSGASKRLLEIFYDKYNLMDHLRALKSYLMLGAGDFAELLMEALAPRLSKPAISLYRHHLTSDLESAIRASNAQYDSPDVLRRLDARILEFTHGELGWDCFALEYRVDEAPLNAVLDAKSMDGYERVFHHLWHLKRVESSLTQGWMRVTSGSRTFERLPGLDNDWHHCRVVQAEMVHFLRQLQAYVQLEVVECSWQALVEFTAQRAGDLDALIAAHRAYLDRVVRKALLMGARRERDETLLDLVREALDYILQFKAAADDLYGWSLAEATRLDRGRDAERGLYTDPTTDDAPRSAAALEAIRGRVRACALAFQDRVVGLCREAGTHADLDIRFLAIRVAFNGHYALRRTTKKADKK